MNGAWRTLSVVLTANTAGFIGAMGRAGSAAKVFGTVVAVSLALSLSQAIQFESAMAGVAKTVDATAGEMRVLERGIISMANRMPATREEIAGVAEAAGQLGISKDYLLDFTKVAVDLGVTTNLSAADAATGLAKIANVMGTSERDFDRLGATLVELGNNGASTEADILAMSQRLSGIGQLVGASEADVLALANAMSSVGIEAELGGGATQRIFQKIHEAVLDGGSVLEGFAVTAGMSAESFATAWSKDPVRAYEALIRGLDQVDRSGGNVGATLDSLGIKGTYNRQVIFRLMGASDVLSQSLDDGRRAWEENTALTDEATKRYATAASQLKIFRNQVTNIGRAIGAEMIPGLLTGIDAARDFGGWLAAMAEEPRLAAAWQKIATTGEHLAEVLEEAHDAGKPLVEALLALGGGAIVAGLTGVASGLEAVGGFLAGNEILTKTATAALAGWAAMQAWGIITKAFYAIQVASWRAAISMRAFAASDMGTSLSQMARGIGQVATGLPILGTNMGRLATGMRTLGTGVAGFLSTTTGATLAIGALALVLAHLWSRSRETTVEVQGLADAIEEVAQGGAGVEDSFKRLLSLSLAGLEGGIKSVGAELNTALTGVGMTADDLFTALEASGGELTAEVLALASSLDEAAPGAGSQYIDLVYVWAQAEGQAQILARRQDELGVATGGASDEAERGTAAQRALADATGRSVEDIIAQDEAWQELTESMRETWAGAFDLGSAFSGRLTLRELDAGVADLRAGVTDNVREIEDSLTDASREIGESLTDSIDEIRDSLSDADGDIGEQLTKSLKSIDKDLTRTIRDVERDLARARREMSGEELADALARGQERISDATADAADRRAEAEEEAAERRAEAEEDASEREAAAIEDAREREAEAVEDAERRKAEAWEQSDKSISDYVAQHGVTAQQIQDFYADQTIKASEFATNIGRAFELGYDPSLVSDLLQQGPEEAAPIVEALVNDHSATLLWTVNAGVAAMETLSDEAVEIARLTAKATGEMSDDMARELDTAIEIARVKTTLGTRATADAIAEELGIGADKVKWISAAYQINLVQGLNDILVAVGGDPIQAASAGRYMGQAQSVQVRNAGGFIPGPDVDRDVVPAMLTPGEYVLTRGMVREVGIGNLEAWRRKSRGFNTGGEVLLAAGRRLEQAGARITEHPAWDAVDPVHVQGSHHYRNTSGTGADAFDANYGAGTSAREMAFFDHWAPIIAGMGLRVLWRVAGHYNHLHADLGGPGYYSAGPGGGGGHFRPLPAPTDIGDYLLADVTDVALKKVYDQAQQWANMQYSPTAVTPVAPNSAGGHEANRAIGQAMAAERGWTGNEWNALDQLWQHESGWNHLIWNRAGSGAYGIPQSLPASKMASHGADYMTNPRTQIAWGLDYIRDRPDYGRPSEAWRLWNARSPHWYNLGGPVRSYDTGGYLPTGLSLAHNGTGRPEPVGHHLTPADRAFQPTVHVEPNITVQVGNEQFSAYVVTRSEGVVDTDHRRTARLARAGQRHG